MRLSAVVPTLNEARVVRALVGALAREVDEVVVADGGSEDDTVALAEAAGVVVVLAPRGRGRQLHAGAAAATGDRLWFVHADTRVEPGTGAALRAATESWGCFATRVDSEDLRLRFCGRWMTARARWTGSCTGDMGLWCDRALYDALGGFARLPAFEDLDFSDRARARAAWEVLAPPIGTSARRWAENGVNRTILKMWALRLRYRMGADPIVLARRYSSSNPRLET
ncbi:MAG: TIGR04283 family arsenosugar biosynthesis glycosyltransferase [Myxococcota bacterium]